MKQNSQDHRKHTIWSLSVGLGLTAVLVGTAVLMERGKDPSIENPVEQQIVSVIPGENILEISGMGIVQASHQTLLAAGISGKVSKLHPLFTPGSVMVQGTPLIELEKFEYRAKLAKAQADLEQARVDLATEQAEALKAVKKEYRNASKSGSESELVLRVPQRRAVNARVNAAEAYVEQCKQELDETIINAPYTCQIVSCSAGVGTRLETGQVFGAIIPLRERIIRVPIPLEDFSILPRDASGHIAGEVIATCKLNNGMELSWNGHVTAIDSSLTKDGRSVILITSLDPNESHLPEWRVAPLNLSLHVQINVPIASSAWIPVSDIKEGNQIRLKSADGKISDRPVSIVTIRGDRALVQF